MKVTRVSLVSGLTSSMDLPVTQEQLDEVNSPSGRLIQHIFPELTADQREFILTGITPEEWDELYGEEE